jgi:predicted O-methyltransferase YrrM
MSQPTWSEVDAYIAEQLLGDAPMLASSVAAGEDGGRPPGGIPAYLGKLLELLVRMRGARSVLEIGTFAAYSTIWLGRGLGADGRLITLEADPAHAEVARLNLSAAGLGEIAEVRVGDALDTLPTLLAEGAGPFDLTFIDADKQNNPAYLEWSLKLSRPGSVIVVDNVIRAGAILDPDAFDERLGAGGIQAVRRFYDVLAAEPRLTATAIQTVDGKGHDGFVLALVTD